jgi:hypothetical protein
MLRICVFPPICEQPVEARLIPFVDAVEGVEVVEVVWLPGCLGSGRLVVWLSANPSRCSPRYEIQPRIYVVNTAPFRHRNHPIMRCPTTIIPSSHHPRLLRFKFHHKQIAILSTSSRNSQNHCGAIISPGNTSLIPSHI